MKKNSLVFFFIIIFIFSTVYAEEYFVEVYVNHTRIGEFLVYDIDGVFFAEKRLFEKLGFSASEDLEIEKLKNIGTYDFQKNIQKIYIHTKEDIFSKKKKKDNYKTIQPTLDENFFLKSSDIQTSIFFSEKITDYFFNIITSGKIYKYNTDVYLTRDRQNISLEYPYNTEKLQTISFGYIPNINANGFSISNLSIKRPDDIFEKEKIYVTYPLKTRIEIYRNDFFLKEIFVDKQPCEIELENQYYENNYVLKAYKPDGTIEKKEIKRNIMASLLRPKTFEYRFSVGQEVERSHYNHDLNLSYGLYRSITLNANSTGSATLKNNSLSSTISIDNSALIQPFFARRETDKKENIYGSRFFFNQKDFFFSTNIQKNYINLFLYLNKYQTNINYVSDILSDKTSLKKYLNIFNRIYTTFEIGYTHTKDSYDKDHYFYGVKSTYFLHPIGASISAEYENRDSVKGRESFSFLVNKNIKNQAYINFKTSLSKDEIEKTFKVNETQITLNLHNHKYISLMANYTYNHKSNSHAGNLMLNFSLDFSNLKLTKDNLKEKSIIVITAFYDKNDNQIKDSDEENIDFTILFEGKRIQSIDKKIILYLENKDIFFDIESDFDFKSDIESIKIPKQRYRNDIVNIQIPFYPVDEVFECFDEKQKYRKAALFLEDKKIAETEIKHNCYAFQIRKAMKEKYKVELY